MSTKSRRAAGLTIAWMVVAAAMATFAWQAVSAAGTRVNQQPLFPLSAGVPVLEPDPAGGIVVVPLETSSSTSRNSSTTLPDGVASSTASTGATSTSAPSSTVTPPPASTSTSTSAPGTTTVTTSTTSTSSTTAPAAMQRASYTLVGGTITIEYGNGEVVLISAVPKAGFATDIDSSGPSEVDVDFRSETHRSKFDAEMSSGQLVVSTKEEVDD